MHKSASEYTCKILTTRIVASTFLVAHSLVSPTRPQFGPTEKMKKFCFRHFLSQTYPPWLERAAKLIIRRVRQLYGPKNGAIVDAIFTPA